MIIRVRCPAGGDTEEYIMLELQGKVEPTGGALVGCDGQLMGYLSLKVRRSLASPNPSYRHRCCSCGAMLLPPTTPKYFSMLIMPVESYA